MDGISGKRLAEAEQVSGIVAGGKGIEVVNAFADADKIKRQRTFFGNCNQNSAFGRAVELGNDQAVHIAYFFEGFDLFQSILSGGGVNGEQGLMRSVGNDFFDDADDFFNSSIKPVLF